MPDSRHQRINVLILCAAVTALLVGYFESGALLLNDEWTYGRGWR